jgi:hypothetical protein
VNVYTSADVVEPFGVYTAMLPVRPIPVTAVMVVGDTTVKEAAAVPLKKTPVAPVKFVPVIVTVVPIGPCAGLNDVMAGGGIYVKPGRLDDPAAEVTFTLPEAPGPTTATILVSLTMENEDAGTSPKLTALTPPKVLPVMVTEPKLGAEPGEKDVMTGGGR